MSELLDWKDGVKARKRTRCDLCGELIEAGDMKDVRSGVVPGEGFWKMNMHPECHAYEKMPGSVDIEWYEDIMDPAFDRKKAIAAMEAKKGTDL
jgi:hypothetical protein